MSKTAKLTKVQIAKAFAISTQLIDAANIVRKLGCPELVAAVDAGEVSVTRAAKIAKATPPAQQLAALRGLPKRKQNRSDVERLRDCFDRLSIDARKSAVGLWNRWLEDLETRAMSE